MPERLLGKRAVVVGAGQTPGESIGNGRAMATLFAREGAEVLCVDLVRERAEETVAMIEEEGGRASALQANVTKAAECVAVADVARALGGLDILVNNVGIVGPGPAHLVEEAAFDRVIDVNLKGMWLMTKAALGLMREQTNGGAIVNISSISAVTGGDWIAYEISKAGVNRLTTSVAISNARHRIRCNAIMPGLMDTPMAIAGATATGEESQGKVRAERDALVPLGRRMGTAWDTANAALFLASDEAKFITGVILPVDGGYLIRAK